MEERYVESTRGKTVYWIGRNANPKAECIIFLHGLTADHTLFDKQILYFSSSCTVIVWDAPAHGKSRPYKDFTYVNGAEELKKILDTEEIQSAVMVGQSMGGYHIQAFLLKYPERVKAFIGIDTCPFGLGYYSKSDMWWLRQVEWMLRCYPHKMLVNSIAKSVSKTDYACENMRKAIDPYSKDELCRLMGLGYSSFTKENQDMKINCPVLLLVGEYDKTGKVKQYCEAWHKREDYPLHIVKGAAHNANADNFADVNKEMERFICRL